METALFVVLFAGLLGVQAASVWALLRFLDTIGASVGRVSGLLGEISAHAQGIQDALTTPSEAPPDLTDVWDELDRLKTAVAEGIAHVERTESRIAGAVGRAQKELRRFGVKHPGLEAEAQQLHLIDGAGGDGSGVPNVPQDVAQTPSSIPGVTQAQLLRARARG